MRNSQFGLLSGWVVLILANVETIGWMKIMWAITALACFISSFIPDDGSEP